MSRNNVKLLTAEQLKALKEKYIFEVDGENVIVSVKDYNRKTRHKMTERFHINSKIRKIIFTPEAIKLWVEIGVERYSLLDIQQAVNKLYVVYQPLTIENVKKLLSGHEFIIRKI